MTELHTLLTGRALVESPRRHWIEANRHDLPQNHAA